MVVAAVEEVAGANGRIGGIGERGVSDEKRPIAFESYVP